MSVVIYLAARAVAETILLVGLVIADTLARPHGWVLWVTIAVLTILLAGVHHTLRRLKKVAVLGIDADIARLED